MAHALVTGGTGFVGSQLIHQLVSQGWQVTALHRSQSSDESIVAAGAEPVPFSSPREAGLRAAEARPDTLFHLATHQQKNWDADDIDTFVEANVSLGAHLLRGVLTSPCVVVNAMSYFQYRHSEPHAFSLYSATKQAYAEISRYFRDVEGMDIRDVVLFDNYGAHDPRPKLINSIIDSLRSGAPLAMGPPAQPINALHVSDVALGLIAAAAPGNPARMAVKADHDSTVAQIVDELERIAGTTLEKTFADDVEPNDMVESAGEWPRPLDWRARFSLAEGLALAYGS